MKRRDEVREWEKYRSETNMRMLFWEDLEFLRGRVDLFISSGLDSGGEIEFHLLVKVLPDEDAGVKLSLVGQPALTLSEVASKVQGARYQREEDERRESLSPKSIKTMIDGKGITLLWTPVKNRKKRAK